MGSRAGVFRARRFSPQTNQKAQEDGGKTNAKVHVSKLRLRFRARGQAVYKKTARHATGRHFERCRVGLAGRKTGTDRRGLSVPIRWPFSGLRILHNGLSRLLTLGSDQ